MHLTTTIEQAPGQKRTRPELRLHGAIPWPENATAESLANVRGSLIDVDAGSVVWGANPFRAVATLDVLAPTELDDELLSSVLKDDARRCCKRLVPGAAGTASGLASTHTTRRRPSRSRRRSGESNPRACRRPEHHPRRLIASAQGRLLLDASGCRFVSTRWSSRTLGASNTWRSSHHRDRRPCSSARMARASPLCSTLQSCFFTGLLRDSIAFRSTVCLETSGRRTSGTAETSRGSGSLPTLGAETVNWRIARAVGFDSTAEVKSSELDATIGRLANIIHAYKPIIVYYSVDRGVRGAALQDGTLKEALPYGMSDFRLFFKWFHAREDLENETRIHDSAPGPSTRSRPSRRPYPH